MGSVGVAGFATGCLGVGLGRSIAKGGGLSLASALGLFEFECEVFDLSLLGSDGAIAFGECRFETLEALGEIATVLALRLAHKVSVATRPRLSCASSPKALNKYLKKLAYRSPCRLFAD